MKKDDGWTILREIELHEWIVIAYILCILLLRFFLGFWEIPVLKLTFGTIEYLLSNLLFLPGVILKYMSYIPQHELILVITTSAAVIYMVEKKKKIAVPRNTWLFLRAILSMFALVMVYDTLSNYQEQNNLVYILNQHDYTQIFMRCDQEMFGIQPTIYLQQYANPLLTEIMYLTYGLHFVFPIMIAYVLAQKKEKDQLNEYILAVVILIVCGTTMYFIFPGKSPIYTLDYTNELKGYFLSDIIKFKVDETRNYHLDCCVFPSIHVALAALNLLYAFKYTKKTGKMLAIPIILSWIATVYLRRHWAIDGIAGIILASTVYKITPSIYHWWNKKKIK
ncbi:MAG: phosphatase PAP2 family protein [Candidatus Altiarchaeota archaeon]|nr:phosphatase PAP2 family protein [Candidatus Altiarchaeota archaeon]